MNCRILPDQKKKGQRKKAGRWAAVADSSSAGKKRGRQELPYYLKRERLVHDLAEQDKHCAQCGHDLRHLGEEVSERYERLRSSHSFAAIHYGADAGFSACLPEVRLRLHGENRHQAGATIGKSTASASVLAHVIVSKLADHLYVHRQAKIMRRFDVEIADQTSVCTTTY